MRPVLSLKTLLRSPFKTLITFLLIAAASLALFSRITDYAVTEREMNRAASYYHGVAALDTDTTNTYNISYLSQMPNSAKYYDYYQDIIPHPTALMPKLISSFSSLPGVSSADTRYMTAGVIEGMERIRDYSRYDYTARFVMEGTFAGYITHPVLDVYDCWQFTDCKPLAGGVPLAPGSSFNITTTISDAHQANGTWYQDLQAVWVIQNSPYNQQFADSLTKGDRCLLIGRWTPKFGLTLEDYGYDDINQLFLGDQDTIDFIDSFYLLNGKPQNYLETDEFSKVREIVDITDQDLKTFDIVYTSNMSTIPRFGDGSMVIKEGRMLTGKDTSACVINQGLMELNGLKIGDKIKVGLCDKLLEQHGGYGALAVIPERYSTPVKTVELEIVGTYKDTDPSYSRDSAQWWNYTPNTLFVPSSLLPVDVPKDHEIKPGEFSVFIGDAKNIKPFYEKAQVLAKQFGVTLRFSDQGWLNAADNIQNGMKMSLITTLLFVGAAAVALLLSIYLYIGRSSKNYAIMRALGTPKNKSNNALFVPMAVITVLAIPLGGITGLFYASRAVSSATKGLASVVTSDYVADTSLPVTVIAICLLCEILFLILVSALFMRKLAKTPTLALLQGEAVRVKVKKDVMAELPYDLPAMTLVIPNFPQSIGYHAVKQVAHYLLNHMRRSGWKTAIAMLLTIILTGAMGIFAVTKVSYQELWNKTEVRGTLTDFDSTSVIEMSKSDVLKDFYYSGEFFVKCNGSGDDRLLSVTNDFDRYVQSKSTLEYSVEYTKGYDASLFSGNEAQCVVGNALADMLGVRPGDRVMLLSNERVLTLISLFKDDKSKLDAQIAGSEKEFTVAGVITSKDQNITLGIFAPSSKTTESISVYNTTPFPVEYGEFKLVNKNKPQELISYLDNMSKVKHMYSDIVSYHMDTTELDNIRHVRDMLIVLFPIAAAAAILLGFISPMLIIMQSAKEAAIMRILGTTKQRARCMLALEQISLCIFGLAIAAFILMIYNFGLFTRSSDLLALCGGLYLLGCICAAICSATAVTRRKVLELLQAKE